MRASIKMDWRTLSLSEIVEQIPVGVVITRRDGRIDFANARAHMLLGAGETLLAGRDIALIRTESRFAPARAQASRQGHAQWQDLSSWRTLSGSRVCALETIVPMVDEDGEVRYFVHFLQQLSATAMFPG
ncbi:MAG: hypothetical protein A3D95_15495 [Betaproteobacteria bacterium RIFCSPHIGHO2_12_FULL_69_13]|nr:MAG: hypothetical protein A3D95_15495 [Betaproteobacteria bacterium RIFCSPHIGHO2_12_FULL_69_13]OGA65699.1 MAG: hypothetical protein A3G83_02115 [Betaproteobacteria bacterium RIFCSPLOWO2_12_FULL_68_20]